MRRSPRPAEALGSSAIALGERFARERPAVLWILPGVVLQTQLDGIDGELVRELVDGRFERKRAGRFAGTAIERRRAQIQPDQTLRRVDIRDVVEHPRLQ